MIDARLASCFLHKATIPKINAKTQQIIHKTAPIIVKHKTHHTKAKTKLAIANPFDWLFPFSVIFLIY
jgi:hypothetical protein